MIDQDLLEEIQYALLEPPDGGQSWPSEVWTREEVLDAVTHACISVVRDTHAVLTYVEQFLPAGSLSLTVPEDCLTTAHLVWRAQPSQLRTILLPADAFEADQGMPGWEIAGATNPIPLAFVNLDTLTQEVRLIPTPFGHGIVEHLYVPIPAAVEGRGEDLPLPDALVTATKYHALSTLLSGVHRLQDPARAAYCDERYAIEVAVTQMLLRGGA